MKRRFVVFADEPTELEEATIVGFLKGRDITWWHWFSSGWLLVTESEIDAEALCNQITSVTKSKVMVMEVAFPEVSTPWAGFGPAGEKENMFTWLHENWMPKEGSKMVEFEPDEAGVKNSFPIKLNTKKTS